MIFVFILPSNTIFRKTERECEWDRARVQREREEEERAHCRRPTSFDFAGNLETSHTNPDCRLTSTSNRTQIAPFDFASEPRGQDRMPSTSQTSHPSTLPTSHAFNFVEMAPIALSLRLRNGWVLINLTRFDEFFFVGFWWIWPDLCLSIEKWYYIFVWKLRKCEKM